MENYLITADLKHFLENKEFIYVGTTNPDGRVNVAPKFLVKTENDNIYLADFVFGKTWENLQVNHYVSLATSDTDTLVGFQINGSVEIIDKGPEYEAMLSVLDKKEITFSVEKVIKSIERGKKSANHEVVFPDRFIFFKVRVEEIVKIGPTGKLERKMK
ncbi:MAG TPA: pyridoxamine 5'-phosphate oxidase family protein [Candidatus Omnitrophota bacterium]|nr:pyridoxamine 5'-phosphate oxidase family protein [Candidatus Omnitrophota bacterium]